MKARLTRVFAAVVVMAMLLAGVVPGAVLARPPMPGIGRGEGQEIESAARDLTPVQAHRLVKGRREPGAPNPQAAARLQANEARLAATGQSPKAAGLGLQGTAKLLVIPVEFTGTQSFAYYPDANDCSTSETVTISGPLHNQMPDPAPSGDNYTFWLPDFGPETYAKQLFDVGPQGGLGVVRRDLNGGAGVDLSGLTAANYYLEQSRGAYRLTGTVLPWMQLPVSVGEYGANSCEGIDDLNGGVWRLARDAAAKVNELYPGFDWNEYDTDHDGVVDHLVIIHAGADEAGGGGAEGPFAIWSHSWVVGNGYVVDDRGTADPNDDIRVWNYTTVPENADIGVIVHEYAHDLGLPDLYANDVVGSYESVGMWDIMSDGSWTGPLAGMYPSSMCLWDRVMLGWADPVVLDVNSPETVLTLGQLEGKPQDTADGAIVRLPLQMMRLETAVSPTHMWWGNWNQCLNDARLWRDLDLRPAGGRVMLTFQADWDIEEDWDFAFVEVSTDDGATWAGLPELHGYTVPEDYADPGGNQARFGGRYGLTGASDDWTELAFDLSAYAGQRIRLRLRYVTDEAVTGRGLFVDDLEVRAGEVTVWSDDVEGGPAGWHSDVEGFDGGTRGPGWIISDGVMSFPHYYLMEWRNDAGFDKGLAYAHSVYFADADGRTVSRTPYSLPGLLLWYRNFRYADNFDLYGTLYDAPSYGPKGALLVVDSHPDPLCYPTVPGSGMSGVRLGGRAQTGNALFSLKPTNGYDLTTSEWYFNYLYGDGTMTEPGRLYTGRVPSEPAVSEFHDSLGYYPGLARQGARDIFVDHDASVVIPAKAPYWPRWLPYGSTGNPGLGAYGVNFQLLDQAANGTWGKVRIYNSGDTFISRKFVDKAQARKGEIVTITIVLKDSAGSRYSDDAPFDYQVAIADSIPAGCSFIPGSLSGGGEFVRDNQHWGSADTGQVIWRGTIGGNRLNEPDALISYKVRVNVDTPVGRAMLSEGLVQVLGAGASGYLPKQRTYTLAETITVAPSSLLLPVVSK